MKTFVETERKFLVKNEDFKREAYKSYRIKQGYISATPASTVRVRVRDDEAFLTIKGMTNASGMSRFEWEKEISLEDAEALFRLCVAFIDKTRHLVKNGNFVFEVDEFHGRHEGLIIAEIELPSEDASFDKPSWLGEEVTGIAKYYNASLAACN